MVRVPTVYLLCTDRTTVLVANLKPQYWALWPSWWWALPLMAVLIKFYSLQALNVHQLFQFFNKAFLIRIIEWAYINKSNYLQSCEFNRGRPA